jgi:hypothetical protein
LKVFRRNSPPQRCKSPVSSSACWDLPAPPVATGPGAPVQVNVFHADSSLRFALQPFAGFAGGATVATGELTGDGVEDSVVGAAAQGHVKIVDGTSNTFGSFFAFDGFFGGVAVG